MKPFCTLLTAGAAAALLGLSATASMAFQETPVSPADITGKAGDKAGAPIDLGGSGVELNGVETKSSGTVIRIPGLGKLGTLPKLDFGLELLYADEDPGTPDSDATTSEDVLVRGAIKHRF